MIKNIEAIEKALKLEPGSIKSALETEEEVELSLPELVVFTKEEHNTREANIQAREEQIKETARIAGLEYGLKTKAKELGIELDAKTPDAFFDALMNKAKETGTEATQREKQLESDLNLMKQNFEQAQQQAQQFQTQLNDFQSQNAINSSLSLKVDPKTLLMTKDRIDLLFKAENKIEVQDGRAVLIDENGNVRKDEKTLEPLNVSDVYNQFVSNQFVKQPEGGAGGVDEPGTTKAGTYEHFEKEMTEKGHSPTSEVFQKEMLTRQQAGTLTI